MSLDKIRRERMVAQLEAKGIRNRDVLEAMRGIPREEFVDEALRGKAYREDAALPIGEKQTISQPWVVARMSELTEPDGHLPCAQAGIDKNPGLTRGHVYGITGTPAGQYAHFQTHEGSLSVKQPS